MHVLITGTTLSGKSTLARQIIQKASETRRVLVLDALLDPAYREAGADFITPDVGEFLAIAKKNKDCTLVIDEAGNYCGQYDRESWWLATQARHWGHQSIFITQRANMVAKNIRDNCSKLFCFRISPTDAKLLCDDFCYQELLEAPLLPQGECFYAPRYGGITRMNVFT